MTWVSPLAAVAPRVQPRAGVGRADHRMALIAELIAKTSLADSRPMPLEPLLTLLSDTETLSLFIRHAGLSKEQGAALVRDLARGSGHAQASGALDEALAKIRPTTGGLNGLYGAHNEISGRPIHNPAVSNSAYRAEGAAIGQFTVFAPTQFDQVNTLDDIRPGGAVGRDGHGVPPGWFAPIQPQPETISGMSGLAYGVIACFLGALAVTAFLLVG